MKIYKLLNDLKNKLFDKSTNKNDTKFISTKYKNITDDNFILVKLSISDMNMILGMYNKGLLNYKTYSRIILQSNNNSFKQEIIKPSEYLAKKNIRMDDIYIFFGCPTKRKNNYILINLKEFLKGEKTKTTVKAYIDSAIKRALQQIKSL